MTNVTVIGLGNMGGAVAARLAEAFPTTGFDLSESARAEASKRGVIAAADLASAVADADVVVTSLPNPAIVRSAWTSPDGVLAHAKRGVKLVEISTIDPHTMRELETAAHEAGIDVVVDSPVSGGPAEALAGTLGLFVGGTDAHVESVREILEHMGTPRRTGGVGTAKTVKIVNNMMTMANVAAAAEAFALGVAAGVEPQQLFDVLSVSGGTSHHFVKRWPNALKGDYEARFTVEMAEKDLALAMELARSLRLPTPVASTGNALYQTAIVDGFAGKDIVALLALYEKWATARD